VIVLDTPPSRSAAAFLEAPQRLDEFLQSRLFTAFLGPTGSAARATGMMFAVLRRLTGVGLLKDLTDFFQLVARLLGGLRERAHSVDELLSAATTAFLIITTTETAPRAEAIRFGRELKRLGLNRAGVIVNRVQPVDPGYRDAAITAERLASRLGAALAEKVGRTHAEVQVLAQRDHAATEELRTALSAGHPIRLPDRDSPTPDAELLVWLARELFGEARA
jgi:anion-transporting  ArsA/GET3 family ATPase